MIRLSLSRGKLARMHEGQLINVAWWLWECEELIAAETGKAVEDLISYGFCEIPHQPGKVI